MKLPLAALALASTLIVPAVAQAAPGDLDGTFGGDGVVLTPAGDGAARLGALAVTPGGFTGAGTALTPGGSPRLTVAGWRTDGAVALAPRLLAVPALDDPGDRSSVGAAIVARPGGVLAGGFRQEGNAGDGLIASLTPSGALDPAFSGDGVLTEGFRAVGVRDLLRSADGRVTAVGARYGIGFQTVEVRRYDADGRPDTTFAGDGSAELGWSAGGPQDGGEALAPRGGGVLVGGWATTDGASDTDFALTALGADGAPDPAFGANGRVLTSFAQGPARADDVAALPDGGFVAVGRAGDDAAIARYDASGDLVASFGTGGRLVTSFGADERLSAVAVDAAGRIVVAGTADRGMVVARFTASGARDATFGGNGVVRLGLGGSGLADQAAAEDLVLQADRIVVAGNAFSSGRSVLALAALRADDAPTVPAGGGGVTPAASTQTGPGTNVPVTVPAPGVTGGAANRQGLVGRFTIRLLSRRAERGAVRVRIGWPRGWRGALAVRLSPVGAPRTVLGSGRVSVRGGRSQTVRVKLTAAGRRALIGRRTSVVARLLPAS